MISQLDTLAGSDLVLPLCRHDFGISAGDLDVRVHACLVMRLDDITAVDTSSTDTAVVRALWSREASRRPTVRPPVRTQKGVFLFQTEPKLVLGIGFHQPCGVVSEVVFVWGSIWVPSLAHDQNVGLQTDWIGENGDWTDVDIRIVTGSLAG